MNRRRLFLAAMACLLLLGCGEDQPALDGPETIADTILSNGRIYTVDPAQAWVEAVAIRDGKYIYVGDSAGLATYTGPETRQIDLQGKMAMPGINDVHSHPWQGGTKVLYGCNFAFSATPDEIADIIAACVARDADAQWITGGQWTSDFFINHDLGSPREWMDRVSGD